MKISNVHLAIVGFTLLVVPAISQDRSSNHLRIKQMREALTSDSPIPNLPIRLEEVRMATLVEILQVLNSPDLSISDVDSEIRGLDKDYWAKPASIIRKDLAGTNVIVVAYAILYGGASAPEAMPIIEAFRKVGYLYQEAGHGGGSLIGSAAKLEELPSPWPTELWFLAHGQQTRVMQYHEKMAIYSFNGTELKEQWITKVPLAAPEFQITKNALHITYGDEERSGPLLIKTIALTQSGALETSTIPKIP
jgi:hypothetical protein